MASDVMMKSLDAINQASDDLRDRVWVEIRKQIEESEKRSFLMEKIFENAGSQCESMAEEIEEEKKKRLLISKSYMLWEAEEKKGREIEKDRVIKEYEKMKFVYNKSGVSQPL